MRRTWLAGAALAVMAAAPPAAESCLACHGKGSPMGSLPGRPAAEIETAMAAFRTGSRPATIMQRIVPAFSADEIHALAQWFEALK